MIAVARPDQTSTPPRHSGWVRACHWIGAAALLVLVFTGVEILMVHPRLYWGEAGNDLTPALLELPISRNLHHDGIGPRTAFFDGPDAPVSAPVEYDMFNENGWGRSLHFLAGWILVAVGLVYLIVALATGHLRRHLAPRLRELTPRSVWADLRRHLRLQIPPASGGPTYGLLQRLAYLVVICVLAPLMVVTGLAMSPAVAAAAPFLTEIFGGAQSARTVHFFTFAALVLFLLGHVAMVLLSGFRRHMRAMTFGR
jgi:thiosulfate reductase cytochrome b subunit